MPETKRIVTMTGVGKVELAEVQTDRSPLGPEEVSGKTVCSLLSPGTELSIYQGFYNDAGIHWGVFPANPGYASAFVADEVGEDVNDIAPGDLVFTMGPHAGWKRRPRKECIRIPDGLAPELAVFCRLINITMSTLSTTRAQPAETVLITGLGPVGHLGAKMFAACGYRVVAVDPIEERRDLLSGCDVDLRESVPVDDPEIAGKVAMVVECSGHEQAVIDSCQVVRKRGEVVLVGVPMARKTNISAQELLHVIFRKFVDVRSGSEWEIPRYPQRDGGYSIFGNMRTAMDWLADGRINVDGLTETLDPENVQQIYDDLLKRKRDKLFQMLTW
ncbi:MAG: zinc-binding dehydrogenase [Phycisphaerae bacterium]